MPATILVVDDSPTELRLITAALANKGFEIITATDGDEAIAKATALRPKLIVLDVVMPKKNGFQVCRQLKSNAATKEFKVLLLTSKNEETDRFWGLKQGADAFMTKPFLEAEFVKAVNQFMN